jgi:adenine phosphoribosyltransferase
MTEQELLGTIRTVPDFPAKGIMFRDITTLLKDREAFRSAVDLTVNQYKNKHIDLVVCIESRGFILGAPLAYSLHAGFVPIRKPGKLPAPAVRQEYVLEYGTDAIEIHRDAIKSGDRVLLHDDLLATGGTMRAAADLVRQLGGEIVGLSFLIELTFLHGREKLKEFDVHSVLSYDEE